MSVPSIKSSTDECNELKNIKYKTKKGHWLTVY